MHSKIWTPELVALVAREFDLPLTSIHGPAHWTPVRSNGLRLEGIHRVYHLAYPPSMGCM